IRIYNIILLEHHKVNVSKNIYINGILNIESLKKKDKIIFKDKIHLEKGILIHTYDGNLIINENTFIGPYCCFYCHGGIEIGKNTLIAMHTCILSSNHTIPPKSELIRNQPDIKLPTKI